MERLKGKVAVVSREKEEDREEADEATAEDAAEEAEAESERERDMLLEHILSLTQLTMTFMMMILECVL